jgi:predicted house-cleaning NTP pyrophosphatase (Maf/HAM1 superfamily)
LKDVRREQRREKLRRNRIIRVASKLEASELMEIAGMKDITVKELCDYVGEMKVPKDEAEKQQRVAQRMAKAKAKSAASTASAHEVAAPEGIAAHVLVAQPLLLLADDVPTEEILAVSEMFP